MLKLGNIFDLSLHNSTTSITVSCQTGRNAQLNCKLILNFLSLHHLILYFSVTKSLWWPHKFIYHWIVEISYEIFTIYRCIDIVPHRLTSRYVLDSCRQSWISSVSQPITLPSYYRSPMGWQQLCANCYHLLSNIYLNETMVAISRCTA